MVFLNSINVILDSKPHISLLVFNSLSFPFSTLPNPRLKPGIMEHVGRILSHISAVRQLVVNIFFLPHVQLGYGKNCFEADSRVIDCDHVSAGN